MILLETLFARALKEMPDGPPFMSMETHPLSVALQQLVPHYVALIHAEGGPEQHEWKQSRPVAPALSGAGEAALRGIPTKTAQGPQILSKLAFGLALLSFSPSGVPFCGVRYRSDTHPATALNSIALKGGDQHPDRNEGPLVIAARARS